MVTKGKTSVTVALGVVALLFCTLLIAGCTSGPGTNAPEKTPVQTTISAGTQAPAGTPATIPAGAKTSIKVSGSTTVLPIAQKAAEELMKTDLNADIQVTGGGSGVGVQQIGDRIVDIGMSSREVTAAEMARYPGFVVTPIAYDGMAIILNSANPVSSITLEKVRDIYAGNLTNWKDLGGQDAKIVVIGRDSTSGTRSFFTEKIMGKVNYTKGQQELNSNGAIQQAVSQTPGAIGYVGLGYLDGVKALPVDVNGTLQAATVDGVKKGTYPLSRPLYLITNGKPTGLAKEFIDYIIGPDGQKIVESIDYVPLS